MANVKHNEVPLGSYLEWQISEAIVIFTGILLILQEGNMSAFNYSNETQSAWRFRSTWNQDSCTVYVLINHPNLMNTLTHFSKIVQFWSAKITFQMAICSSHRGPRGISSLNHVIVNCNLVRRQCSYYYNVTMS